MITYCSCKISEQLMGIDRCIAGTLNIEATSNEIMHDLSFSSNLP